MSKVNKKIYGTLDYKHYAIYFSLFFCMFAFVMAILIALTVTLGLEVIVFPVFFGLAIAPFTVYYGYKLFSLLLRSNDYSFVEVDEHNFSIVASSIEWYKQALFSVKVVIGGKEYTSNTIVSAHDYAEFEEDKKIVVGVNDKKGVIVIVQSVICDD